MIVPTVGRKRVERRSQIPLLLYGLFLAAIIVDVGGAFGLKYAVFIIISAYVLIAALTNKIGIPDSFPIMEGVLFAVAPVFFLFLAIGPFSIAPAVAVRELTPFATWLLYPLLLLIRPKERIISFFTTALFWGAVLAVVIFCGIFLLHILGQGDLISRINTFTHEYRIGYFGQNPLGGNATLFFPNVYFRWTLLLIPAAILSLRGNKMKRVVLILAAFMTASAALILFLLVGLLWASFGSLWRGKISKLYTKRAVTVGIVLLVGAAIMYVAGYGYVGGFVTSKLSPASASTAIKVGHIESILNLMSSNIVTFLFGMGVGSSFYSIGVNKVVINVEVSHFNLMRQFGVIYALGFFAYVLVLFISLRRLNGTGRLLSIGLAMLFIAAGTNPLLISPVFFLVLVISRAYITLYAKEKRASTKLGGLMSTETSSPVCCWPSVHD